MGEGLESLMRVRLIPDNSRVARSPGVEYRAEVVRPTESSRGYRGLRRGEPPLHPRTRLTRRRWRFLRAPRLHPSGEGAASWCRPTSEPPTSWRLTTGQR